MGWKVIPALALGAALGLAGCGQNVGSGLGGSTGPSKQQVFTAFLNFEGAQLRVALTIDQMHNFQCEKAAGEPGFNCDFDISEGGTTHFKLRAYQGDEGNWIAAQ